MEDLEFPRPEGYSEEEWEAYIRGFRRAMELQHMMASQYLARLPEPGEDDQEAETCPECGRELVGEIGSEEKFCLECDTTHDN